MLLSLLQSLSTNIMYFMLHLSQANSFPKPLSAKEEQEEFIKFHRDGDINARNKLVNHNMRLVAHIIKKYYSNYSDQEDIISIGTIGLIKAINTFDYTKGTRLATYASRCIENATLSQMSFWLQKTHHWRITEQTEENMYIMSHTEKGETKFSPSFVLSFRLMAPRKLLEAQLFNKQYYFYCSDLICSFVSFIIALSSLSFSLIGQSNLEILLSTPSA